MGHIKRKQLTGCEFHLMNRGAARQNIFVDDLDRKVFLSMLEELTEKFEFEILAFVLMDNHYHLQIRAFQPAMSKAMHRLGFMYTRYFNNRHGRDGPLFRGRYKSVPIEEDDEAHFLGNSRYIHRNPVEHGFTKKLDSYRWSSLPAYLGRRPTPVWLNTKPILEAANSRGNYRSFVYKAPLFPEDDLVAFKPGA